MTATEARRRFPAGTPVTLTAAGQSITATGRGAALLAELALHLRDIEGVTFGTVALDLTPTKVSLRVVRAYQPLHLEGDAA